MREQTRQRTGQTLDLEPPFSEGLDTNTHPALLGPKKGRDLRNVVLIDESLSRRKASVKTTVFGDPTLANGSKILGTSEARYAWFTPPTFPKGGFVLKGGLVAKRPAGNFLHYFFSSWTAGAEAHGVVWAYIGQTGVLTFKVEWDGGAVTTLTTAAQAVDAQLAWLLVYDPPRGTLTLYLDGAQAAQATGLDADLRPRQDAGVKWYLGLSFKPGTGPDSNTGLGAAMGPFIGFALRGADLLAGGDGSGSLDDKSLLGELRQGIFQDWPNPASRMILFHYSMREQTPGDLVPMTDASKFKNDGAYVGSPSSAAALVWGVTAGQFAGNVRKALIGAQGDGSVNIVGLGGQAFFETVEKGRNL